MHHRRKQNCMPTAYLFIITHNHTNLFSRLPLPVSRNPFAKGLLSIFNCVICGNKKNDNNKPMNQKQETLCIPMQPWA